MLYKVETSTGSISVTKNVIGKIVMHAIKKYSDKVRISSHKGKVLNISPKADDGDIIKNMDITMGSYGLDIRVYVVINFGSSIGKITNTLVEEIYACIKEFVGIEPNSVAIVVTGMISKKQMTRRNIEVKR